jgi:hypothetical protein
MTQFKIDKNIEPPVKASIFEELEKKMEVGDSIVVTASQRASLSRVIKNAGHLCTTVRQENGDVRVWKLDKKTPKTE